MIENNREKWSGRQDLNLIRGKSEGITGDRISHADHLDQPRFIRLAHKLAQGKIELLCGR